ncbi:uncharacterized protein H6S33_003409 [Morchella sextelata]|uniref:uncharacterized protein n=1 Tax=Morchella sextelata TaxID=1174677 RepID=UPI001D044C70|nr:uncharacterized protein H6S33_003409 [Morchella sextelata]KAH0606575.1 hypothetical protein H6S33_003409 [Morchella sextelata]
MPMPKFTTASGPGRTKRINWSPHVQHLIRKFYLDEGVTLDKLPQRMWEHGFRASRRSYCSKLREWGWRRKKKGKISDSSTRIAPTAESSIIVQSPSPEPIIEEKDPMEDLGRALQSLDTINNFESETREETPQADIVMADSCHSIEYSSGLTCAVCFGSAMSLAIAVRESDSEWANSQMSNGIF